VVRILQVIYGTFNPSAPYGAAPVTFLSYVPGGLVALFLDQQFGLLTFAPALGIAGLALFGRDADPRSRRLARIFAAVAIAYLAASASYWMWWAGVPAPPARFATATLPLLAVSAAIAWARASTMTRGLALALLAVNVIVAMTLLAVDHGALAWDVRGPSASWLAWLGPVVDLSRGWPSFFWRLTPPDISTEGAFARHARRLAGGVAAVRWRAGEAGARRMSYRRVVIAAAWWLPVTLAGRSAAGLVAGRAANRPRPLVVSAGRPQRYRARHARAAARGLLSTAVSRRDDGGAPTQDRRATTKTPTKRSGGRRAGRSSRRRLPVRVVSRRPVRGTLRLRSGARECAVRRPCPSRRCRAVLHRPAAGVAPSARH
jgi:hypothetical protein